MEKWEKVYSSTNQYQTEIVKAVLEDYELNPVLINKQASAYAGVFGGKCEVFVSPENVERALNIIQNEIKFE